MADDAASSASSLTIDVTCDEYPLGSRYLTRQRSPISQMHEDKADMRSMLHDRKDMIVQIEASNTKMHNTIEDFINKSGLNEDSIERYGGKPTFICSVTRHVGNAEFDDAVHQSTILSAARNRGRPPPPSGASLAELLEAQRVQHAAIADGEASYKALLSGVERWHERTRAVIRS